MIDDIVFDEMNVQGVVLELPKDLFLGTPSDIVTSSDISDNLFVPQKEIITIFV